MPACLRIRDSRAAPISWPWGSESQGVVCLVNVKPGLDHYYDPKGDVKIIYDSKVEQSDSAGLLNVQSEIIDKVQADPVQDPGFPVLSFIAKSDIGRRDPAAV